jgi:hypothetical protein
VSPAGDFFPVPLGSVMPFNSFRKHLLTMLFAILDNAILSVQNLPIGSTKDLSSKYGYLLPNMLAGDEK